MEQSESGSVGLDVAMRRALEREICELIGTMKTFGDMEAVMRFRAMTEISIALSTDDLLDLTLAIVERGMVGHQE